MTRYRVYKAGGIWPRREEDNGVASGAACPRANATQDRGAFSCGHAGSIASNAQDMIICGPISSAQHVSMQATVPRRSAPFSHTDVQGSCERMHAPKPLSLLAGRTSSVGQA
ncbi:hypothetical protein T4B_5196 [Trichinella pseudospiralis]|uniref:Uncharacterized protein n=1 Tax=Trichinella pseudospiralis TaxID=6337 RepID=A0A0V1HNU1_TRIPS|nr:hypothetical protein T4B_5196 [Trichinella pseudospiralis]